MMNYISFVKNIMLVTIHVSLQSLCFFIGIQPRTTTTVEASVLSQDYYTWNTLLYTQKTQRRDAAG